ncbi:MAG: hypothetical protein BGO87_14140 [Flavobacteriia bacterium 40-80]|nr:MAG: hypothetical protein BGO87_14140 [Flavobacteriia bacterium 40-80]
MIPVKIIIPIYKEELLETEILSLNQCAKILGDYPVVYVAPESLNAANYLKLLNGSVLRFPDDYFENINGYNRLMLSNAFYKSFIDTDYILIYQLDAYVFKNELKYWCEKNYDYIGAPAHNVRLNSFEPPISLVTLNGGLSLRKVRAHLNVLNNFKIIYPFSVLLKNNVTSSGYISGFLKALYNYIFCNNTYHLFNKFDRNEDFFWAVLVPRLNSDFKVPPAEVSCFFSIDNDPEKTFELTGEKLPFGCHAFDKNSNFWEKYI